MISDKESSEPVYLSNHATGKYGRLRSRERGWYLAEWIGQGKQVLDLGCRDGELTRFFAAGNKVTGADSEYFKDVSFVPVGGRILPDCQCPGEPPTPSAFFSPVICSGGR
ncbi:MAG TPA: methionine biosynthesis protein MetW [Armatimonadota bacterium]|nr:methionine biosynthesis protein MetW [Armatimonadota bacterium]